MQKIHFVLRIWHRFSEGCVLCMLVLLTGLSSAAMAATQASPGRLNESSSAQDSKAIQQLTAIYNNQSPDASLEDKRALLIALISLNLYQNQLDDAQRLDTELTQLAAQNRDDWARIMALSFQAELYTKQGRTELASQAMTEKRSLALDLFASEQDRTWPDLKAKYDALMHDKQVELQGQKDYAHGIEVNNDQLRQTIYILSLIVAIAVGLLSYFAYRRIHATNRLLIEANMKLEIQSLRDPLTGLLTRHAFHDSMKARMKVTDRRLADANQPPHAMALLDVDHFKVINDKFGHGTGDQVLIEVSNRLMQIMRENDKLMRWTGEEFLLFLNNITTENLERVIQRVLSVVGTTPFNIDNKTLNVTVSVGYISLAHGKESDVDEHWEKSLKLADAALYKAKINGRNQAVGIPNNTIAFEDLDAILTINLDELTDQKKIVVSKITGPQQRGKMTGTVAAEC